MNFNEKLMKLRKEKGLSQQELADVLNVSRQTVSKWELGETTPEIGKLVQISEYFNVKTDELLSNNDNSNKVNTNNVKSSNASGKFVGIDAKYIPTGENQKEENQNINYVKKDKKSKKFLFLIIGLPLLFFVIMSSIIIASFFAVGSGFKDMFSKTFQLQQDIAGNAEDAKNDTKITYNQNADDVKKDNQQQYQQEVEDMLKDNQQQYQQQVDNMLKDNQQQVDNVLNSIK